MCGSVEENVKGAIINLRLNASGKCEKGGGISRRLRYSWKNKNSILFYSQMHILSYIKVNIPKAEHVVHMSIRLLG